jgi:hypothetical protein
MAQTRTGRDIVNKKEKGKTKRSGKRICDAEAEKIMEGYWMHREERLLGMQGCQ